MTRPRTYQTEAIIVKKTRLGEADRILTLYTPDLGKIQAVAKGVRRPRSKLAGHLELLTHSTVTLARGRNLDTIIGSQTVDSFMVIRNDIWLTSCTLYACELVNQFTAERIENRPLFQVLLETLHRLAANNTELALRQFEMQLLDKVGYGPQIQQCTNCQRDLEPVTNFFCPATGGMLCPDCQHAQPVSYSVSLNALKVLRLLQRDDWNLTARLKIPPELSQEVELLIRDYLRYLLERDVKSTAWLDSLRRDNIFFTTQ